MFIYKFLTKQALRLHNFSYKLCSKLAILQEGGIHPKHRLMDYHKFFLDNISSEDKVLDIGCGNGFLSFQMAQKVEQVLAIDKSDLNIKKAKEGYKLDNLRFVLGDVLEYNFETKFDVIVLSNVLEHIKKRKEFLFTIKDLSNKLLIRAPLLERSWIVLYKKEMGVEYRLDKGHFIEYTFVNFKREIKRAGFLITDFSIQFGEIWAVAKKL